MFGGVDRQQNHFNDTVIYDGGSWREVTSVGDIPTPRSGHATAAYGKYMFLHGGMDFKEEVAYNDLYIFNTGKSEYSIYKKTGYKNFITSFHYFTNFRVYGMEICGRIRH